MQNFVAIDFETASAFSTMIAKVDTAPLNRQERRNNGVLRLAKRDHLAKFVTTNCGYDLTNHHHALADAEACAVIALKIL